MLGTGVSQAPLNRCSGCAVYLRDTETGCVPALWRRIATAASVEPPWPGHGTMQAWCKANTVQLYAFLERIGFQKSMSCSNKLENCFIFLTFIGKIFSWIK